MEAVECKLFEHKDKKVGESGYSHDGKYRVIHNARMKNPETRKWLDCVIYSDIVNGNVYVRERIDFIDKFKEETGITECPIISTGGLSKQIIKNCKNKIINDENLILDGLRIISERNN